MGKFTVAVVYLRSPKTPMTAVMAHDDPSTQTVFERAYAEHLKARQVKAVWLGVLYSIGTGVLLILIVDRSRLALAGARRLPSIGCTSGAAVGRRSTLGLFQCPLTPPLDHDPDDHADVGGSPGHRQS